MKKILFIISGLGGGGGAEKVCTTIGTKLYENGYDVHYLTFYDKQPKYSFKGKEYCLNEKLAKNILIGIFKLFRRAYEIKKYCKKNNIEVCISFMEEANFSNILSKTLFGNKAKIVVSIRQFTETAYKNNKFYKKLISLLYPKVDKIIVVSNEQKQTLNEKYGIKEDKIETIYNPIDLEKIQELSKEDLGEYKNLFNNGKFTFITVGRLSNQKNHKLLIDAFQEINKKYPNTQLIIIGEGELRKKFEKQIKDLKLENKVFLLGLQKNPYKFLINSNCFVFTSKWEGFPNVLLEALACGLPVITSDCSTGPAEILRKNGDFNKVKGVSVEDYGILYPEGNKEELLKAMEKIYLDENLRKNLKEKAVERAEYFDVNRVLKNWEKLFKFF